MASGYVTSLFWMHRLWRKNLQQLAIEASPVFFLVFQSPGFRGGDEELIDGRAGISPFTNTHF